MYMLLETFNSYSIILMVFKMYTKKVMRNKKCLIYLQIYNSVSYMIVISIFQISAELFKELKTKANIIDPKRAD